MTKAKSRLWMMAAASLLALPLVMTNEAVAQLTRPAPFTEAQATQGKAAFEQNCAGCHGANLEGQGPAVALKGQAFAGKFGGGPINRLFEAVGRMPPGAADSVDAATRVNIVAYLLQQNGARASSQVLPAQAEIRADMTMGASTTGGTPIVNPPIKIVNIKPKAGPSRLDGLRPVTEAEINNPSANDWLSWRRTRDALGFSPLRQINRNNVKNLQLVWSFPLPTGANMMAPIVRDGVMFTYSSGDVVEALDATTGQLLWRHQRPLDAGAVHISKKGLAIAGDKVIVPTSDAHVLALNAKTGAVIWDLDIDTKGQTANQIKSAPLIVGNKAIIGMNGYAVVEGGNYVLAVDLDTGRESWRFNTVAAPGTPGGNTWNDLPAEARSGGSVWQSVSYDPQLNLIYFGTAPTYATTPLRPNLGRPGVNNDALYTNATIALNPDTGRMVWYYQHQANDQLDLDWVFERQLLDITVNGVKRRVVATAGKHAIYEVLDAATGQYLFNMDLGLQNVFTAIDPVTGAKTLNPAAIPPLNARLTSYTMTGICPNALGARNMMSASYSPATGLLYVPTTDTCFNNPNRGRWQKNPTPQNADTFGITQALDLNTRKVVWTRRDYGPPVSGNLSTAGGLLFTGDTDRWFRALDERNGRELWKVRLDNEPESYPITYSVNGKQYVAVATNQGWVHIQSMRSAARITALPTANATMYVFALPD